MLSEAELGCIDNYAAICLGHWFLVDNRARQECYAVCSYSRCAFWWSQKGTIKQKKECNKWQACKNMCCKEPWNNSHAFPQITCSLCVQMESKVEPLFLWSQKVQSSCGKNGRTCVVTNLVIMIMPPFP